VRLDPSSFGPWASLGFPRSLTLEAQPKAEQPLSPSLLAPLTPLPLPLPPLSPASLCPLAPLQAAAVHGCERDRPRGLVQYEIPHPPCPLTPFAPCPPCPYPLQAAAVHGCERDRPRGLVQYEIPHPPCPLTPFAPCPFAPLPPCRQLQFTAVNGTVPEAWSNMKSLGYIGLASTGLQSTYPPFLTKMPSLKKV